MWRDEQMKKPENQACSSEPQSHRQDPDSGTLAYLNAEEAQKAKVLFERVQKEAYANGYATAIETAAQLVESRAGDGPYAESMGAHRILTSAAEAVRSLLAASHRISEEK